MNKFICLISSLHFTLTLLHRPQFGLIKRNSSGVVVFVFAYACVFSFLCREFVVFCSSDMKIFNIESVIAQKSSK